MYTERVESVLVYQKDNQMTHQAPEMLYRSFDELDPSRLPDVVESMTREDMIISNTFKESSSINSPLFTKEQEHFADVMLALLYLTVGGQDEAHDIVLPYSLPEDTDWGGHAIFDSPALASSRYCHGMVHRMEGMYVGELGMIGWDNSCSWFDETPWPMDHPLYAKIRQQALSTAENMGLKYHELVKQLFITPFWDPKVFVKVCSESKSIAEVDHFCNKIHNLEWELLLKDCNIMVNKLS